MTTIDHLAYPHIIDLIWPHLAYPTLVAASRTCRAWRTRSLPDLAEHVSIRRGKGEGLDCELIVSSRNLKYPDISVELGRGTVKFWQLGMHAPLPRQRWYVIPIKPGPHPERSRWIPVFKKTRIVDWRGFRSLAIEQVGILPAMISNRPPETAEPVSRLFENFTVGESLGGVLDWAPNVIFLDVDASRGLAIPTCGSFTGMLERERGCRRTWRVRQLALNLRCMTDPGADLVAVEHQHTYMSGLELVIPIIITAAGGEVLPDAMAKLLKELQYYSSGIFGLDQLLPPGTSWDGLLVSAGLIERDDMFLFDNIPYGNPGDYISAAWQDRRRLWGRLRDYKMFFPDQFLVHTVR
ncbi:hypothetical protein A1Q1_01077 [Trichosporon asahii var. asahii CBS 2479]|uniref:F-box domain-containing protein n=1 Tax=Trichosporon asahii var. asahii (strain ATCC 90039 / CBS 2479 / JCM 2466 / KCTC 7840 / NBRC 103889/ NCYC 2677 / UAMH 7654) TaxID=1186058 RepID=J5QYF1_TRIAS|nr:hypothetical protein A1Q1_01077 [Trichosporon asahii var. asahii CBS 2479]EJT49763.1 hypothetical protein A1Q1_01077 [Trichosporon asahii var. asahii CBS 2479]